MTEYEHILDAYGSLAATSGQMAEAARHCDWDRLIALEQDYRELTARLECIDDARIKPDAASLKRKAVLIRQVLRDDSSIREVTKPWMSQLVAGAANVRQESRLRQAYEFDTLELGAGGF